MHDLPALPPWVRTELQITPLLLSRLAAVGNAMLSYVEFLSVPTLPCLHSFFLNY